MPNSLRTTAAWRVSIGTTLAFAVGTAIAFAIMHFLVAREIRERSDAWLGGEAEVLSRVSQNTPPGRLYDRIVAEVAELATQEVPDERNAQGQRLNSVFFLQTGLPGATPLWVGPGSSAPFLDAIRNAKLSPGIPQSVRISGWGMPFRVVIHSNGEGRTTYLGLSDDGAVHLLSTVTHDFFAVWATVVLLGFLISFTSAHRMLLRVEEITETVARIGSDDLSSRVPEGSRPDEVSRLSRTFNRMLERIQDSVNQLRAVTSAVAHDLKSPVTSIRGKLEMALSSEGDWQEQVAEAIEGLDRLSQLLNTTLDLAEAEAGALPLRREKANLAVLMHRLLGLYQPAFAEHGHELTVDMHGEVPVDIDVSLINRALANLLDNELRHLPPGRLIAIAMQSCNSVAEVIVSDNGPGFPPELKSRVLERFVKGQHSTGHGLGLAFVNAAVRSHGGAVVVSERPTGGALIKVSLPLG